MPEEAPRNNVKFNNGNFNTLSPNMGSPNAQRTNVTPERWQPLS